MKNRELLTTLAVGTAGTVVAGTGCCIINKWCAIICVVLGAVLTAVFAHYTRERYRRLNELNDYLSMVCAGNYDLDIASNTEGELSILQNNLYKVISILRTQNDTLRADRVALADSLADISHQLKTPLTSMMVMTDLLREESDDTKRGEFLTVIENQLDKMKWLITNLLKISKLDAGTITLRCESTPMAELVRAAVEPFLITMELRNISLRQDVDDCSPDIDPAWTTEAVQNVIKNCIEHTPSGGMISITAGTNNLYDSLTISDNGCGIAPEELPHIFERFYHGSSSSADSVGIGLALARTVLEKQNATITARSTPGVGTDFDIRFYKGIV